MSRVAAKPAFTRMLKQTGTDGQYAREGTMETAKEPVSLPRICYIYTTFPIVSETFLQREMRVIREQSAELRLYTIWGGKSSFEGQPVHRFRMWELILLIFWLPYWILKKPDAIGWFWKGLLIHPPRYLKNWLENLLGFAFAVIRAREIQDWKPEWVHAVWATMPSTAAILLQKLIGIRFSMGAHAYDIFQKGGDCFLTEKIEAAEFIHTSTKFAKTHLHDLGAKASKVHLIRRGLSSFPPLNELREDIDVIRFLSIGRLVEKKGYIEQFRIYRDLRKRSIPFVAEIIGEGPQKAELEKLIEDYGLHENVNLVGKVPHENIQTYYHRADLFMFTGKVAKNGDRNGLANVIPEAMARGIPVLTTPDSGIVENFKSGYEVIILPIRPVDEWVATIKNLMSDFEMRKTIGTNARYWVERNFSARRNSGRLFRLMEKHIREAQGNDTMSMADQEASSDDGS